MKIGDLGIISNKIENKKEGMFTENNSGIFIKEEKVYSKKENGEEYKIAELDNNINENYMLIYDKSTDKITSDTKYLIYNTIYPLGTTYTQYPFCKNPNELWPFTKWENISNYYSGLFFRVEGDEAYEFEKLEKCKVSVSIPTQIEFENLVQVAIGDILINPINFEKRTITSQIPNSKTYFVNEGFSNHEDITELYIFQGDTLQGHKHLDNGHSHPYVGDAYNGRNDQTSRWSAAQHSTTRTTEIGYANISEPYNCDPFGTVKVSKETRAKNMTIRLWKRIS